MPTSLSLPQPQRQGGATLTVVLDRRTSCREFASEPLTSEALGQCLWAAQGRNAHGRRTAPSAGALYPLEVYVLTPQAVERYDPAIHRLIHHLQRDLRRELASAALGQMFLAAAPVTIVLCAVFERVAVRYGKQRGERYTLMEIGHAAQNVLLQAEALGLGSVAVGAFDDAEVQALLELPAGHIPLYLLPIGHPGPDS
ncbi:MAG TPA: SagB/ThcOx family dehydrogenase [Anaerolineales bacterium]|nr:SagB/ThcOx family dehydrogenase [Anaerolineales bacterium]